MATIAHNYTRRGDVEARLTTMFAADHWDIVANDFTEEGRGDDGPAQLVLYYVQRDHVVTHVGTWHKNKRRGWIFQTAYDLFKEKVA